MKKLKFGFTLSEMLVTLGVIGFISFLVLPTLKNIQPNKEKLLLKKAYYTAERLVAEIANDEELYPIPVDEIGGKWYLANTEAVVDPLTNRVVSGKGKFCELFKARLNLKSESGNLACDSGNVLGMQHNNGKNKKHFTTVDGVDWQIYPTSYNLVNDTTGEPLHGRIWIDVNGVNKGKNCFYNESPNNESLRCLKPDKFYFVVEKSGRFYSPDQGVLRYLDDKKVENEAK